MHSFPAVQSLEGDSDESGAGHLWILEAVEGVPLRFQLQSDGQLRFGTTASTIDPETAEPAIRPALRSVRSSFERDTLRESVSDVETVTFFGVATCQVGPEYDWDALPTFLGYDVHTEKGLLPPDRAHEIFERLGLTPAPALQREVRADAFRPDRYDWPDSTWRPGPVAAVRVADKHGWRGSLSNPTVPTPSEPAFETAAAAAKTLVAHSVDSVSETASVEEIRDQIARRHRAEFRAAQVDPSGQAFTSAVAAAVQRSRTE